MLNKTRFLGILLPSYRVFQMIFLLRVEIATFIFETAEGKKFINDPDLKLSFLLPRRRAPSYGDFEIGSKFEKM